MKIPSLLLVEDSEIDFLIARRAFNSINAQVDLIHVMDGAMALEYLRKENDYVDVATPDLVLLDLNMPKLDGRQVMAEINQDSRLQHIPVVVLTTSKSPNDIMDLYRLRCSSYVTKPIDFAEFTRKLQLIVDYWFSGVELPTL